MKDMKMKIIKFIDNSGVLIKRLLSWLQMEQKTKR